MKKEKRFVEKFKTLNDCPTCFDQEKLRLLVINKIYSVIISDVRNISYQDKVINYGIDVGLKYLESVIIGGNELIVRFVKNKELGTYSKAENEKPETQEEPVSTSID